MIRLNEAQLKRIIAESVKKGINEIGDTPEGRMAIARAADKANGKERYRQAKRFQDYLKTANKEAFGDGAGINSFHYINANGNEVRLFKDGEVKINNEYTDLMNALTNNPYSIKTEDVSKARKLSKWIVEQPVFKMLQDYGFNDIDLTDWHTWAAQ